MVILNLVIDFGLFELKLGFLILILLCVGLIKFVKIYFNVFWLLFLILVIVKILFGWILNDIFFREIEFWVFLVEIFLNEISLGLL